MKKKHRFLSKILFFSVKMSLRDVEMIRCAVGQLDRVGNVFGWRVNCSIRNQAAYLFLYHILGEMDVSVDSALEQAEAYARDAREGLGAAMFSGEAYCKYANAVYLLSDVFRRHTPGRAEEPVEELVKKLQGMKGEALEQWDEMSDPRVAALNDFMAYVNLTCVVEKRGLGSDPRYNESKALTGPAVRNLFTSDSAERSSKGVYMLSELVLDNRVDE